MLIFGIIWINGKLEWVNWFKCVKEIFVVIEMIGFVILSGRRIFLNSWGLIFNMIILVWLINDWWDLV